MSAQRDDQPRRSLDATPARAIDPHAAAGDYSAGDLPPDEAAAFARLLTDDPRLQREVAGWEALRSTLATAPVPAAPPDLAARIVRRAALAESRPPLRLVRVRTWCAVAAALLIGLGGGFALARRGPAPVAADTIAWGEDGSGISAPAGAGRFMPRADARLAVFEHALPSQPVVTPWLGVWIRPVELHLPGVPEDTGHYVVRTAIGGSAAEAGIVPGDILLGVAGCPLATPLCIAHALRGRDPGERVVLRWWRAADATVHEDAVVLRGLRD